MREGEEGQVSSPLKQVMGHCCQAARGSLRHCPPSDSSSQFGSTSRHPPPVWTPWLHPAMWS